MAMFLAKLVSRNHMNMVWPLLLMENCLLVDIYYGSKKVVVFTREGRLVRSYEVERPSGMAIDAACRFFS